MAWHACDANSRRFRRHGDFAIQFSGRSDANSQQENLSPEKRARLLRSVPTLLCALLPAPPPRYNPPWALCVATALSLRILRQQPSSLGTREAPAKYSSISSWWCSDWPARRVPRPAGRQQIHPALIAAQEGQTSQCSGWPATADRSPSRTTIGLARSSSRQRWAGHAGHAPPVPSLTEQETFAPRRGPVRSATCNMHCRLYAWATSMHPWHPWRAAWHVSLRPLCRQRALNAQSSLLQ